MFSSKTDAREEIEAFFCLPSYVSELVHNGSLTILPRYAGDEDDNVCHILSSESGDDEDGSVIITTRVPGAPCLSTRT